MSRPGEPIVLGSQLSIQSPEGNILAQLQAIKPHAAEQVPAFLEALVKYRDAGTVTLVSAKPIQYQESADQPQTDYGNRIKILDSREQPELKGTIYLLDLA